jgi:hypothetical protein
MSGYGQLLLLDRRVTPYIRAYGEEPTISGSKNEMDYGTKRVAGLE